MSTIPFEKQYLAVDPIEQIQHAIAQGSAVSGDELVAALPETHQLDPQFHELLRKFSVPAKKQRGRPRSSKALPPALPEHVLIAMARATAEAITERIGQQFKKGRSKSNRLSIADGRGLIRQMIATHCLFSCLQVGNVVTLRVFQTK